MNFADYYFDTLLNEGGAGGHMAHPFNLSNVKTGKDLLKVFERSIESLRTTPGAVKIDGVNASIRLVKIDGKKQFALDRGSKKPLDIKGITKEDLIERFGEGHGMVKIGQQVLDIFNNSIETIQPELQKLGLWSNSSIMFNMEYVSGKTNVQDYNKDFLAIHGLLKVYTKEVQGKRAVLVNRITQEVDYKESIMQSLIDKLEPFAKKYGFEIYGSVPTKIQSKPNFNTELNKLYTIEFADKKETRSLSQWLDYVNNIPKTDRVKITINNIKKDIGALSKEAYFNVFSGTVIEDLFEKQEDINKAIKGAIIYLATEKLGDVVLNSLSSPMGDVKNHEGVVIRDKSISSTPFKITGSFITRGAQQSAFR